jgi:hypothetical protein
MAGVQIFLKTMRADASVAVEVVDTIPKIEEKDKYTSKRIWRIKRSPKWLSLLIVPLITFGYYIYPKSNEGKNFECFFFRP